MDAIIVPESDPILAWHWLREDGRLNYPPHTKVEPGQVLRVEPPLELCRVGLHGSVRAIDALGFAPGAIICRTAHWGQVVEGTDKLCSEFRKAVAMADAAAELHLFACDVAERALEAGKANGREPDPRSLAAIAVKRLWVEGKATDEQLVAARVAAWDAARVAAGDAAGDAARDAARATAWATARDAARATAWATARAAAGAAAWAAAWDEYNAMLERRLTRLLGI